jgi:hypothetical protein
MMKRSKGAPDGGSVIVEFGAILPLVIFIIMVCFQALIVGTTVERVENAARTGAREASKAQTMGACVPAARGAMPDWVDGAPVITAAPSGDNGVACRVRAKIPLIWPGIELNFSVDRTVHMPLG